MAQKILEQSDGTPTAWRGSSNGDGYIRLEAFGESARSYLEEVQSEIIEHIPPATTATATLAGSSWINARGARRGSIYVRIDDITPAGDLGGTVNIRYSMDGGVTTSEWITLATIANIGVDDTQDILVELSDLTAGSDAAGFTRLIKVMPFFQIQVAMTGTLAAVDVKCYVQLEK